MFRLLKLSRMARMARLLRWLPELVILIKGMVAAVRSVFFVTLLLFVLLYIFGIAFVMLSDNTESIKDDLFPKVPKAMLTLWLQGALLDDAADVAYRLEEESPVCLALFLTWVAIAALTIMNMLIGVLCEVVSGVAAIEKEVMNISLVRETLQDVMNLMDENKDRKIGKSEFLGLVEYPEAMRALQGVGIDVIGFVDSADLIFNEDDYTLTFGEFMEVVLSLRAPTPPG